MFRIRESASGETFSLGFSLLVFPATLFPFVAVGFISARFRMIGVHSIVFRMARMAGHKVLGFLK